MDTREEIILQMKDRIEAAAAEMAMAMKKKKKKKKYVCFLVID